MAIGVKLELNNYMIKMLLILVTFYVKEKIDLIYDTCDTLQPRRLEFIFLKVAKM